VTLVDGFMATYIEKITTNYNRNRLDREPNNMVISLGHEGINLLGEN
jgi:hypothetical protein